MMQVISWMGKFIRLWDMCVWFIAGKQVHCPPSGHFPGFVKCFLRFHSYYAASLLPRQAKGTLRKFLQNLRNNLMAYLEITLSKSMTLNLQSLYDHLDSTVRQYMGPSTKRGSVSDVGLVNHMSNLSQSVGQCHNKMFERGGDMVDAYCREKAKDFSRLASIYIF